MGEKAMDKDKIDDRNYEELSVAIELAQHTVYKRFLEELSDYPLVDLDNEKKAEDAKDCLRFLKLDELTCKKGEDNFQKLSTVYHAGMALGCSLAVMIDAKSNDAPVDIYVGVKNSGAKDEANQLSTSFITLKNGIQSNFPGTKFRDMPSQGEFPELIKGIFGDESINNFVSSVSCVASSRDKSKTENKEFIQGLEHFVDAMRGNTYTAVFLAEPVTQKEQNDIRAGYENLYSTLSSFRKSVWSYNENESQAVMESLSDGVSRSVAEGITKTQSHAVSQGVNIGVNASSNKSTSHTHTEGTANTKPTNGAKAGQIMSSGLVGMIGKGVMLVNPVIGAGLMAADGLLKVAGNIMQGASKTKSVSDSISNTIGKTLGVSGGVSAGRTTTKSESESNTQTDTTTKTKTSGTTETSGSGMALQIENTNKSIDEMLSRIEEQLKRTKEGEDYGAYNCAAYFLSAKQENVLSAANTYRALMLGEGSSVESSAINFWDGTEKSNKKDAVQTIKEYLKRFRHPVFAMPLYIEKEKGCYITYTAGTVVSGLELPLHLGLPTRSVYGLPVIEHAEFGRSVTLKRSGTSQDERTIRLGKTYHMGQVEESKVNLNLSELTAHTFVTGSTGAGKSNTIYQMLDQLSRQNVNFLVVEPAKGEYKKMFGGYSDVTVYGTNNLMREYDMLRLNPFSFPDGIHVLEHMDRLVEIFNVCWPMYAAMPAILKDAIQRAYERAGWDIETSENRYDRRIFPTFIDVYQQITQVLEESAYSSDNKSDYTGALVTRLKSLTTGINGLIFVSDDIPMHKLFDSKVIVDLSRIGSSETKSLIMGILVLKLQEYRMDHAVPNQQLKHVTVLEEAHNLLRRTSSEQTSEGSNLLGKSVEMLANSIAEMRTYGEGFIIADQSPGLLDMSVIRNTNTKIIMRLPDYSDRELVGKAAGLNEDQIIELTKLDNGVAAVQQSEWLEAVLCKVDKFNDKAQGQNDQTFPTKKISANKKEICKSLMSCIMKKEGRDEVDKEELCENLARLGNMIVSANISAYAKCCYFDYINAGKDEKKRALQKLVYNILDAGQVIKNVEQYSNAMQDITQWKNVVARQLELNEQNYNGSQVDFIIEMLLCEQTEWDNRYITLYNHFTEEIKRNGGIL